MSDDRRTPVERRGSQKERDVVRRLAERVTALAQEPRMAAILQRWRNVNELRRPDRAPVWCRPVGCWSELMPDSALQCTDPWLRGLETGFRQTLFKREIGDDHPVPAAFRVGAVFDVDPPNIWGVDIQRHRPDAAGGAWAYDPPLKEERDFDRLTMPAFTFNREKTEARLAQAKELLGDIMPVELVCGPRLSATFGNAAADLRGLEQMMIDMIADPALMHRLMAFLRDSMLAALDTVEATGLLTRDDDSPMYASDPFGPAPGNGPITLRNLWCAANSQEFDQVSPEMWAEFCLAYQLPIFARFGRVGYGCCENLTHKIDGVLTIPNLRVFTCSAWTDLDKTIDRCGRNYCIMWRQKASDVVFPDDDAVIRRALEQGAARLQGCFYQIVLRELQTLHGHADRLHVWTRHAIEAAERYA